MKLKILLASYSLSCREICHQYIVMDLPDYIQSLRSALLVYRDKYDTQLHYSGGGLLHYQCNLFGMLLCLWAVHHTCEVHARDEG